jgi:hypothetical protein
VRKEEEIERSRRSLLREIRRKEKKDERRV